MGFALDIRCGVRRDLYHIEFTAGKYIDFVVRQKYRIAKQYIDTKGHLQRWPLKPMFDILAILVRLWYTI